MIDRRLIPPLACAALITGAAIHPAARAPAADREAEPAALALRDEPGAWLVEMDLSGGFDGRQSRCAFSSTGEVQWSRPADAVERRSTIARCTLTPLAEALASAAPQRWKSSYAPEGDNGCCDRIETRLALSSRNADGTVQRAATMWYTLNEQFFPDDLAAVTKAASAALESAEKRWRQTEAVRQSLVDLAAGTGDLSMLTVSYSNGDGQHGGETLTIGGDGSVEHTGGGREGEKLRTVTRDQRIQLVRRLLTHEAWAQRTPERRAAPDETRATLTIVYGATTVQIWEWSNDLEQNWRLSRIAEFMRNIAAAPPPGKPKAHRPQR